MQVYQYIVIIALAVMASSVFTSIEIPILKHRQFQQFIREEGPKSHKKKEGTPTMGGIAIYASICLVSMIGTSLTRDMGILLIFGALYGLIGFADDFIKVTQKHNLGLRAWQKLLFQIVLGVGFGYYVVKYTNLGTNVWVPFIDKDVDFGMWFIPFVAFVIVAVANSVNLADGLDGLCAGVTAIFAFGFALIADGFSAFPSGVYCLAIVGSCIGFMFFNKFPAQVFMGDTGSMALGGGLAAAVILTKAELMIPFVGLVFVVEALSVIIQVIGFKTTGKRLFRMAPIHHHFELGGMKETSVVKMFWVFAAICCVAGLLIMKI
ncbi:phospho-N-acetylmuramoyl-pentapeptide-transferase [Aminicella lysinilytica]|uniref:Phospho-N-acetylmuramoyl-pentapeptide-transferase n=1 Tax=Aminicella lysinilytica TaxID=433323 RepID=A0A4R6QCW4_9FIRM|nr:phospho-N-acetylmuramoyl-pentapeptide-transferase [Aminicella lysinilytica]TDP59796.1 phospho-N-acetylmuramoyl-pentapeptide-transferase [Aminicella lysinilytica]